MSLAKISKKLRRKLRIGRITLAGAEQTARDVVSVWKSKRDVEAERWSRDYLSGVREADTTQMESNLAEWYKILQTKVAPRLKEVVPKVYAEVLGEYRQKKKVKLPAVAK